MDELSDRAQAYLDAFAAGNRAPPAPPWVAPTHATGSPWRWAAGFGAVAAVAIGAWALAGPGDLAVDATEPRAFEAAPHKVERAAVEHSATQVEPEHRSDLRGASVRHRPAAPRPLPTAEPEPEPEASPGPVLQRAAARKARAATGPSALRQELALLDRAKAAVGRGDLAAARRSLSRHAKRFPDGLLAPERRRLTKRIQRETESPKCVHSSCNEH